jgi:hypothetical protein
MTEALTIALMWEGERAPFAKAFIAAQMATEAVKKAASNPAFKSKYADLSEVVEATVPALNANGIGVIQSPGYDGELVSIETVLIHEGGSSCTGILRLRPSKTDPQGVGSAITYGRRYSLLAMTGAAPEDDDGNAASGPREHRRSEPPAETGPSAAAQFAADQLRQTKTKDEFTHFWDSNKAGLREQLDDSDMAHVIAVMKAEAKRFSAPTATPFDQQEQKAA